MRDHVKAEATNSLNELTVGPSASNTPERFKYEKDENGHVRMTHNGPNRHERRANQAVQKKQFKKLVKNLQKKAAKMKAHAAKAPDTATFEEAVALSVPQAPDTVPDAPTG